MISMMSGGFANDATVTYEVYELSRLYSSPVRKYPMSATSAVRTQKTFIHSWGVRKETVSAPQAVVCRLILRSWFFVMVPLAHRLEHPSVHLIGRDLSDDVPVALRDPGSG